MDYKQFRSQFDFIFLSGLKGQERVCEIQNKHTNRMYDYKEVIQENDEIDKQRNLCDNLLSIDNPYILKFITYSYCFVEETHGNPYCKFFLVFEYCESSLDREIQTLLKKKIFMKTQKLFKIFEVLINALSYLHARQMLHGNLIPENVCLPENDEYKLLPKIQIEKKKLFVYNHLLKNIRENYKNHTKNNLLKKNDLQKKKIDSSPIKEKNLNSYNDIIYSKNYCAPEIYLNNRHKEPFNKSKIDLYKAEIFSLGMMLLSIGLLENMEAFYRNFDLDKEFLLDKMIKFEELHGKKLFAILSGFLDLDLDNRLSLDRAIEILKSNEEIKEIANPLRLKRNEIAKNMINSSKNSKVPKKKKNFSSEGEVLLEKELLNKLFNSLPQEYQDEIDKKVSYEIKKIEQKKYEIEMYISGNRYQGHKENNLPQGWGIFTLANGERYEGHFEQGKYDGEGIYYWPSGVKHYGQFKLGEITGIGVRYDTDGGNRGNEKNGANGGIYYGEWLKGKNHGNGTYFWSTGAKYQGGFIDDMIYGKGVLTWPEEDGKTVRHYEGLWKDVNPRGITVEQIKQNQAKQN